MDGSIRHGVEYYHLCGGQIADITGIGSSADYIAVVPWNSLLIGVWCGPRVGPDRSGGREHQHQRRCRCDVHHAGYQRLRFCVGLRSGR